ncbi:hypothetical protein [Actinoplanes sp. G11-F43]|uniref:hypothetical protein n=1 Tax=Actinoplanes sp. G11-F43 TaxID=3424130 RepID=UPI003D32A03E
MAVRLGGGDRLAAAGRHGHRRDPVRADRGTLGAAFPGPARPGDRPAPALRGRADRRAGGRPRGTSQAIIQRFLPEIDSGFAREQYRTFRDRFLDRPLALGPAIREYPHGADGPGDVDSGPLILGISLSTTVVALGAAQANGDASLAGALAGFGEFAGLPVGTLDTKRYAFGLVPIGDAFLAWSKSAIPAIADGPEPALSGWWRLPLLTVLLVIGLGPWIPAIRRSVRARRRAHRVPHDDVRA